MCILCFSSKEDIVVAQTAASNGGTDVSKIETMTGGVLLICGLVIFFYFFKKGKRRYNQAIQQLAQRTHDRRQQVAVPVVPQQVSADYPAVQMSQISQSTGIAL